MIDSTEKDADWRWLNNTFFQIRYDDQHGYNLGDKQCSQKKYEPDDHRSNSYRGEVYTFDFSANYVYGLSVYSNDLTIFKKTSGQTSLIVLIV